MYDTPILSVLCGAEASNVRFSGCLRMGCRGRWMVRRMGECDRILEETLRTDFVCADVWVGEGMWRVWGET